MTVFVTWLVCSYLCLDRRRISWSSKKLIINWLYLSALTRMFAFLSQLRWKYKCHSDAIIFPPSNNEVNIYFSVTVVLKQRERRNAWQIIRSMPFVILKAWVVVTFQCVLAARHRLFLQTKGRNHNGRLPPLVSSYLGRIPSNAYFLPSLWIQSTAALRVPRFPLIPSSSHALSLRLSFSPDVPRRRYDFLLRLQIYKVDHITAGSFVSFVMKSSSFNILSCFAFRPKRAVSVSFFFCFPDKCNILHDNGINMTFKWQYIA